MIRGTVDATNIDLAEDFSTVWTENEPQNAVEVIAYRDPNPISSCPWNSPVPNSRCPRRHGKETEAAEANAAAGECAAGAGIF